MVFERCKAQLVAGLLALSFGVAGGGVHRRHSLSAQLVAAPSFCQVELNCRRFRGITLVGEYAYSLRAVLTFGMGMGDSGQRLSQSSREVLWSTSHSQPAYLQRHFLRTKTMKLIALRAYFMPATAPKRLKIKLLAYLRTCRLLCLQVS